MILHFIVNVMALIIHLLDAPFVVVALKRSSFSVSHVIDSVSLYFGQMICDNLYYFLFFWGSFWTPWRQGLGRRNSLHTAFMCWLQKWVNTSTLSCMGLVSYICIFFSWTVLLPTSMFGLYVWSWSSELCCHFIRRSKLNVDFGLRKI